MCWIVGIALLVIGIGAGGKFTPFGMGMFAAYRRRR